MNIILANKSLVCNAFIVDLTAHSRISNEPLIVTVESEG